MEMVARAFYCLPGISFFSKGVDTDFPDSRYYFVLALIVAFAALTYLVGYPFLIVCTLLATAGMLLSLMVLTAADMIAQLNKN